MINIKHLIKTETCWTAIVRDAKTYEVKRVIPFENVVLDQWKEKITKALYGNLRETGDTCDELENKLALKYEQLGTSDQEAVASDTDLVSPDVSTKKIIASTEQEGAEVTTFHFWDDGEAIGSWKEFAIYTADEVAVVRANIDQDISSGETLTIHGKITQV